MTGKVMTREEVTELSEEVDAAMRLNNPTDPMLHVTWLRKKVVRLIATVQHREAEIKRLNRALDTAAQNDPTAQKQAEAERETWAASFQHVAHERDRLREAAIKRAKFDIGEEFVQADPTHFHMERREAIFELQRVLEESKPGCVHGVGAALKGD